MSTVVGQRQLTVTPQDTGLRRGVVRQVGRTAAARHRCRRDEAPGTLRPQCRQRGPKRSENAAEIDCLHLVPLRVGDLLEGREAANPGIGDDDVKAAELLYRRLDGMVHIGGATHVSGDRHGPLPGFGDELACPGEVFRGRRLVGQRGQRVRGVERDDVVARPREGQRVGPALAPPGARNQRHLGTGQSRLLRMSGADASS